MDSGKTIADLLHQAAAGDRAEWLFNNLRMRHLFSKAENILLPVGTTSNESLHAEINGWFRQTQNLHPATLKLKLSILTLSKLLAPILPCIHQRPDRCSAAMSWRVELVAGFGRRRNG